MRVDPDRQWFVYFKETEMGPFTEPDMLKKVKSGELDGTAFVYTDGMSDWELIKDSQLQKMLVPEVRDDVIKEKISFGPTLVARTQTSSSSHEPKVERATTLSSAITQKKRAIGFKPMVAILFFIVLGAGYVLNRDLIDSYIVGVTSEKVIDLSETVVTQSTNPVAEQDTSVNWTDLDTFVRIQDPQGPAFRIADKSLAGMRPVIVGALSPILRMSHVTIAVFPDNDRSLYAIPPIWIWESRVNSGYFSAGPHLNNGQDLLPGRYRVLLASQGKFLGDVGFELGVYPIGDALVTKKAEAQKQLAEVSTKERASLKAKVQSTDTLGKKSFALEALAVARKTKRREWLAQRVAVAKDVFELRESQTKLVSGPMFFVSEQGLLLNVLRSLEAYIDGLEFYSYGGPEHVSLKLNTTIEALRGAAATAWQKLEVATKDIDARDTLQPQLLDAENIKARVLEESK